VAQSRWLFAVVNIILVQRRYQSLMQIKLSRVLIQP